jgi:hypothetical protein
MMTQKDTPLRLKHPELSDNDIASHLMKNFIIKKKELALIKDNQKNPILVKSFNDQEIESLINLSVCEVIVSWNNGNLSTKCGKVLNIWGLLSTYCYRAFQNNLTDAFVEARAEKRSVKEKPTKDFSSAPESIIYHSNKSIPYNEQSLDNNCIFIYRDIHSALSKIDELESKNLADIFNFTFQQDYIKCQSIAIFLNSINLSPSCYNKQVVELENILKSQHKEDMNHLVRFHFNRLTSLEVLAQEGEESRGYSSKHSLKGKNVTFCDKTTTVHTIFKESLSGYEYIVSVDQYENNNWKLLKKFTHEITGKQIPKSDAKSQLKEMAKDSLIEAHKLKSERISSFKENAYLL